MQVDPIALAHAGTRQRRRGLVAEADERRRDAARREVAQHRLHHRPPQRQMPAQLMRVARHLKPRDGEGRIQQQHAAAHPAVGERRRGLERQLPGLDLRQHAAPALRGLRVAGIAGARRHDVLKEGAHADREHLVQLAPLGDVPGLERAAGGEVGSGYGSCPSTTQRTRCGAMPSKARSMWPPLGPPSSPLPRRTGNTGSHASNSSTGSMAAKSGSTLARTDRQSRIKVRLPIAQHLAHDALQRFGSRLPPVFVRHEPYSESYDEVRRTADFDRIVRFPCSA